MVREVPRNRDVAGFPFKKPASEGMSVLYALVTLCPKKKRKAGNEGCTA